MPLCWCIQGPWWINLCSSSHLYAPGWGKQSEEQKLEKAQSQFSKSKGNQKQNKNKKEVMQRQSLAAHQQTDAQSVSRQLLLWKNSPRFSLSFTAKYDAICYVFGQFTSAVPAMSPSNLFSTSWGNRVRKKGVLGIIQALFSNTKILMHYQHCFGHRSKIQQYTSC